MKYLLTGAQMQRADKYTIEEIGIPSMVLMERAALKVVETLENEQVDFSNILVVCGIGNNGGDGYAIARLLHLKGHKVSICSVGDDSKRSVENRQQKKIAEYYNIPILQQVKQNEYSLIIDAVFGVGLSRNLEGVYRTVIEQLNCMPGYKVAVDIPSGISDTTGEQCGIAFCADLTIALAYAKRGHVLHSKHPMIGKLRVVDIGISITSLTFDEPLCYCYDIDDFQEMYPKRIENSHKGSYGKVLLVVGSKGMAGAAHLCAKASYAVGCGLVRIYTHEDNREILQKALPEAMVTTYNEYNNKQLDELLEWADVVGIGCGMGVSETSKQITRQVLKRENVPCVIDADALNIIASEMELLQNSNQIRILTPHMKEMTRLLGCEMQELQQCKFEKLYDFCYKYNLVCVMKDARTLICKKDQDYFLNLTGNSAMAKGGSGDILTGMITGIFAQNRNAYQSACLGVYLHGLAGDIAANEKGKYSVLASDIVDSIEKVLKQI